MISRDQVRAANAFAAVGSFRGDGDKYLALARRLPVIFQTNGLLAGWAHLLAKAKGADPGRSEHAAVAEALLAHLRHEAIHLVAAGGGGAQEVFRGWIEPEVAPPGSAPPATPPATPLGTGELQALTGEAIEYAGWLKRAAEALLAGAGEDGP